MQSFSSNLGRQHGNSAQVCTCGDLFIQFTAFTGRIKYTVDRMTYDNLCHGLWDVTTWNACSPFWFWCLLLVSDLFPPYSAASESAGRRSFWFVTQPIPTILLAFGRRVCHKPLVPSGIPLHSSGSPPTASGMPSIPPLSECQRLRNVSLLKLSLDSSESGRFAVAGGVASCVRCGCS